MIRFLLATLILANCAWAACSKISMPTDFAAVTSGTRANLKANFTETQTKFNPCADSVDEVRARLSGYTGSLMISSLENLRLRLDTDGTATGKLMVETSNGDTIAYFSEDLSAKVFGNLTVAGLTASLPVVTNASKQLASATVTGTGTTVVLSAGPTISGLLTGGTGAFSGAVTVGDSLKATGANAGRLVLARSNNSSATSEPSSFDSRSPNASGTQTIWTRIVSYVNDATNGSEDASFYFRSMRAGAEVDQLVVSNTGNLAAASANFTGNITADSLISSKFYTEGTFTMSLLGCSTTPTGTARYVRTGKQVTLFVPVLGTCTSNAAALQLDGLPAALYTARSQFHAISGGVTDNGTAYEGAAQFSSGSSNISIYRKTALAAYTDTFTGSGTKGLNFDFTLTYTLQ